MLSFSSAAKRRVNCDSHSVKELVKASVSDCEVVSVEVAAPID